MEELQKKWKRHRVWRSTLIGIGVIIIIIIILIIIVYYILERPRQRKKKENNEHKILPKRINKKM